MLTRAVLHVWWFELRSVLRSPMSLGMILVPLLLYPVALIGVQELYLYEEARLERETLRVAVQGPDELVQMFAEPPFEPTEGTADSIDHDELDLLVRAEETEAGMTVHLHHQSTRPRSKRARSEATDLLSDLRKTRREALLLSLDGAPITWKTQTESVTAVRETLGLIAGVMTGYVAAFAMLFSGVYPAVAMLPGEREAGTLETLLSAAVPRPTLLAGKILAGATLMVFSALANAIAAALGILQMVLGALTADGAEELPLEFTWELAAMAAHVLLYAMPGALSTALVVSAVFLLSVAPAKAYREAESLGSLAIMVMLVPPVLAVVSLLSGEQTHWWWLPMANVIEYATAVGRGQAGLLKGLGITAVNLVWAGVLIAMLNRWVDGEDYLLGDIRPQWWRRLGGDP